ncbi:MAG: hypothetical protein IKR46_01055 [Clostridia bacterium]|nr:hypothetical protein [Clostridia bacterium]
MIDYHSHFLPNIDDGAKTAEQSLEMLAVSKSAGVDTVVSTSHCYAFDGDKSIAHFLKRRDAAYAEVSGAIGENKDSYPSIVMGCEVHLVPNLSTFSLLPKLCIENTDYILLEMPFSEWKDEHFEEIYNITKLGLKPIIAHIDRYFNISEKFPDLFSLDLLYQANAESFISRTNRKKLAELFRNDKLHILGSDMHNTSTRPPNLAEGYAVISKKFGAPYAEYLQVSSEKILKNKFVPTPKLPKLGFFKKIML